jgi:hypothetical protein
MGRYSQQAGGVRATRLDVPVRAWWSRERAWHGDDVVLHVETAYLPDHTPFRAFVFEAGAGEGDDPIDEVKGPLELVKNRAAVKYTIRWDSETLGKELVLHGDGCLFVFRVFVEKPRATGCSNEMYVHLHPYVVSG